MNKRTSKKVISGYLTVIAMVAVVVLSCLFAFSFFTRDTGNITEEENPGRDDVYTMTDRGYGTATGGIPSGATAIANETDFYNFIAGTSSYGYLTANITLTGKPRSGLVLSEGRTLDGNGFSITANHHSQGLSADVAGAEGNRDHYIDRYGFNGTSSDAVDIGNSETAYGVSDVISVNYGTIKNVNFVSDANQRVYISPFDGNVAMGGIVGINYGTVTNCTSSFNRGHYGIVGSQWYYEDNSFVWGSWNTYRFHGGTVSTQNLIAFGGIAGINRGEIYSVKVAQNNVDIGVFFSQYTDGAVVPNDAILSGIVGGVVGFNDGGKLVGVDFYGGNCWLYNDNLHNSVSYTGAVVGLANLLGSAQNYTVNSKQWSVAPGKVQNLTLSYHSSYSIKTTGRGTNGKIGERRTNGYDVSWNTNVPAYGGEIGGMLTVNSSLPERIAVYNTTFGAGRQNFGNWVNGNDIGINNSIVANNMPKFGYGTNNSEDYINEITSIQTRFEGQRNEGDQTELTSVGASADYIWDSEQVNGVWYSGLRQNVDFSAFGLNGTNHVVYGATGFANGNQTYKTGSDDYRAEGIPFGGLAVIPDATASSVIFEYSLRLVNVQSASELDAFAGVKKNTNYAFAYANALVLTQNNTISGLNPSASRIMPSWKTIDGNGYNLILSGVSGTFEDGGAQITLGTATLSGVSDFVSLNYGTIKNIGFATTGTRTLSVSKNVAFGGAVGINLGTMSQVSYNFHNGGNSSTEINGSGTASAVVAGAVTGVNAGTMSDIKSVIWQNFGVAGAASFAATGGVVGVNHGAGTLKTVVADGVADATLYARGAGNNYLGGVLGFGSNYGVLTDESGFAANSTVAGNSPFDNWIFAGKQILDTDNAYVGMLAGAAANSPELAQNGNLAIRGMVAMMPQSTHQTGWFTPQKGNMSLMGRMNGDASAAGYVASDLVYGYSIVAADSSTAYVSKLTSDYNAGKSANGVDAYFSIDANLKSSINIYSKTVEILYVNTTRTVVETQGDPGNYDNVYFWGDTNLRIPASLEREDAAIVGDDNPENYAPTVALHYYYEINLDQALSNADTAGGDRDALWFFLSGDSSQVKKAGTYKALAAGAARGVITSDWTLAGTNAIVFTKEGGLDGAGHTVTFENANYETVLYDGYDVTGQIAAVNKSTINNVNVVINSSLTVNSANDLVYGGIVGINEGVIGGSTLTVNGTVNIISQGAGNKFAGGIAGINRGDANSLTVTYAQDAGMTLSNEGTGAGALGGYIGWQDSVSEDGQTGYVLSDVRVDGYRAALTVNGNGVVGGILGAVNTGAANSIKIAGVVEQSAKTVLQNVFLTVSDIRLSAQSGYKGIISGTAADGNVAQGAMNNVVALYPVQSGTDMPWTSQGIDSYSMYGYNEGDCGANAKGLLIKIRDYSNDENAEYLGTQTLSYDASNLYYSYSFVPTGNDMLESRTTTYYSHSSDPSVLDKSVWNANKLTLPLSYVANGEKVPTADVLLAYSVVLYQGYEDRLVQFMSGQGDIQNGFYAGAYKAFINTGVSFALGANTDRGETSSKGKILNGNGTVITLNAGSATATVAQDGFNALGYFFSVNNMTVNDLSFVTDGEITANSENVAFGTVFGINNGILKNISLSIGAAVSVTSSGDSDKFIGGAVGINKGEFASSVDYYGKVGSSVSVRYDADVYVNNTGAGLAVYGGVTGWHNTVNPLHDVAVSGYNRTFSVTGAGAAGGIVGVINTGNTDSLAGGIVETSAKSSLKNVANAIYGLTLNAQYKGLISACAAEGEVRDGAIQNVVAQYTEAAIDKSADGVLEKYTLPWFAASQEYSMYGYNTATGAKASGVLLKISDYSDNEAAEYVGERTVDMTVYGESARADYSFAQSEFDGATSVVFEVNYISVQDGVVTGAGVPAGTVTADNGRYTLEVASEKMNASGDYVPVAEIKAVYAVQINGGTEADWDDPNGMTTSELLCFIDGREPESGVVTDAAVKDRLSLVAGAQKGTLSQNIVFDKPMNAYVTMREEKILDGAGFALSFRWIGTPEGNTIVDRTNRNNHDDITDFGTADYEQITVNGQSVGAAGGLIAVNRGIVRNLTVNHNGMEFYSFAARANGAFGTLIGANFGTVSNVTYNADLTLYNRLAVQNTADYVSFGSLAGYNAGTVENCTVNKYAANKITGEAQNAYTGAVTGHNEGTVRRCTVNIGQEMPFAQRLVHLSDISLDTVSASGIVAYSAAVGYNEGRADQITVKANSNFGVNSDRQANVAAGAAVGINDGGEISYTNVYGWGGMLVRTSVIRMAAFNVFVGGIVGAMNADGASAIGNLNFFNHNGQGGNGKKASISDSVSALSGGIVTEDGNGTGFARYGYVSGVYAQNASQANKADGVFWFVPDKLQNPEALPDGTPASEVPVFHTGNATDLTYISVFGKKPSDEFTDVATNSYGYTFVDIDGNPLNIFVMTPSVSAKTLSLSVTKAEGFYRKSPTAEISGATADITATADDQGNNLTLRNNGNSVGYVTFAYKDAEVYAVTDFTYDGIGVDAQFMLLSFLSGSPSGSKDGNNIDYFDYTTVDGENSKSLRDSAHRAFQLWSGASFLTFSGQNKTVNLNASINDKALILSHGKVFDGGQASGYVINITGDFSNNIAEISLGYQNGAEQRYLVVSEFIAINYGTFSNASIRLTANDAAGKVITRTATDVLQRAQAKGINTEGIVGFVYGMMVGVNEGKIKDFGDYVFDRKITLESNNPGKAVDSVFGGMVGIQAGEQAEISNVGNITFGSDTDAGSISMTGTAKKISAGALVGMVLGGKIENMSVMLKKNSSIVITAYHDSAAMGGIAGDLRGTLSQVSFNSEYQSKMLINYTKDNGVAAIGGLAGVINSTSEDNLSRIEQVKVEGSGYIYNGLNENGVVTTNSVRLYTAAVVALGSNYGVLDSTSEDSAIKELVAAYGTIRPSVLDRVYVDFRGYVRAKNNSQVGIVTARYLDGITEENLNIKTENISNIVWRASYTQSTLWTTAKNYADSTETFDTNTNVAVFGKAAVTIDDQANFTAIRGAGFKLWTTNNLYNASTSVASFEVDWKPNESVEGSPVQLQVRIVSETGYNSISRYTAYYDPAGTDGATKYPQIANYGDVQRDVSSEFFIDTAKAAEDLRQSAKVFSSGIYIIKITYNEVYIHNQRELIAFFSLPTAYDNLDGSGGNQYYSEVDHIIGAWTGENGTKEQYRNAEIGILANDITINYGTVRVTMAPNKILDGNGKTVTFEESGTFATKRLTPLTDDKNMSILMPSGVTGGASEYDPNYNYGGVNASFSRYIGGSETLSERNIDAINTLSKVGIRVGGLFVGRNLGTIQNINFVVPQNISISNEKYGTLALTGIVTAVNAGTIDNCTLKINEGVEVGVIREFIDSKSNSNELEASMRNWISSAAIIGGFAGMQYGTADKPSYISNSSVTLDKDSELRATSQVTSFSWAGRDDSAYAYTGGVVGWLTSDSTIYNITVNGTGTVTAWGDLGTSFWFSTGDKVTCAGSIVGLNSAHPTYSMSENADEYGQINGVICNWNGAAYFLTTGNHNIFYSGTARVNYYIGAQLVGIAEKDSLRNIYFMYGIESYKTFHQDNWYYGDNASARLSNADFRDKYDYIVVQSQNLLREASFPYDAIYAVVNNNGNVGYTEVAYRRGGDVFVNEGSTAYGSGHAEFTFENYANYQDGIEEAYNHFSIYVKNSSGGYQNANSYFTRITHAIDSGGDKNLDYVGVRAAAMMTSDGNANWNDLFKPNNVYIYEVPFGTAVTDNIEGHGGNQLDLNDPDTKASLTFQTKSITSDVSIDVELSSTSMGAQFIWELYEDWIYSDTSTSSERLVYYDAITSLDQAHINNKYAKTFERENDGTDFYVSYVLGMAIKVAMSQEDANNYVYDDESGIYYDKYAKVYDGQTIYDPTMVYIDENGNPIDWEGLGLPSLKPFKVSQLNTPKPQYVLLEEDGSETRISSYNATNRRAGVYISRIQFKTEEGENYQVNTTNRTIMFSDHEKVDIYSVVLPKDLRNSGTDISVNKVYDGTTLYDNTQKKNYSTVNISSAKRVNGDVIDLAGQYNDATVNGCDGFVAQFRDFTFRYIDADGAVQTATIKVFDGSVNAANYTLVKSYLNASGRFLLNSALADKYYQSTENMSSSQRSVNAQIITKGIALDDLELYMYGDNPFVGGSSNESADYNAALVYNTDSFTRNSKILGKYVIYKDGYLQVDGYMSGEKINFYITFTKEGSSQVLTSVKDYGTYKVYFNIVESQNFTLRDDGAAVEPYYIGNLIISQYHIQTADIKYVIDEGVLSKIFDNTDALLSLLNNNLRMYDQNGQLITDAVAQVGVAYAVSDSGSGTSYSDRISAVNSGRYRLYFTIKSFETGNYVLDKMDGFSFCDPSGKVIEFYYITPKEIKFEAVTKEFDNSVNATDVTVYEYEEGYAPFTVSGVNATIFSLSFSDPDVAANMPMKVDTTVVSLGGKSYNILNVKSGEGAGLKNYYIASVLANACSFGNITPVTVEVESVSMKYNGKTPVNYKEGAQITINRKSTGEKIDIYPEAYFNTKSAGTNKTVTFEVDRVTINGTEYLLLKNAPSSLINGSLPETGELWAHNYAVEKDTFSPASIIKNTLSIDDIRGKITVAYSRNSVVAKSLDYDKVVSSAIFTQYRYDYQLVASVDQNALIVTGEKLEEHVSVTVKHNMDYTNGFAGGYTVQLVISEDFDWDESMYESAQKDNTFKVVVIEEQTVNVNNLSVKDGTLNEVYPYIQTPRTLNPVLVVRDMDGHTFEPVPQWSKLTNNTPAFAGSYSNGSKLPVGDYRFVLTPDLSNGNYDYVINYKFSGGGISNTFSVTPRNVTFTVSKEFDNSDSFTTQGNAAKFSFTTAPYDYDSNALPGRFANKEPGKNKTVYIDVEEVTVNGTVYYLIKDSKGKASNNCVTATGTMVNGQVPAGTRGEIKKYSLSPAEITAYINGWIKDSVTKVNGLLKDRQLEYREGAEAGYAATDFTFAFAGRYNMRADAAYMPEVRQGASSVTTLAFEITLTCGSQTYSYAINDEQLFALPVGEYTVSLNLSNAYFDLPVNALAGKFIVAKQEVGGGDGATDNNIFIVLTGDFSHVYGESGFNLPTVDDSAFAYTLQIIDKYTGKVGATFDADAFDTLRYSLAPDGEKITVLDETVVVNGVYVGGYYVWATDFSEELGNYMISTELEIPVYIAGTPTPSVPQPEPPEEGGEEGGEGGETGGLPQVPDTPLTQSYFVLPAPLTFDEIRKTYDGTTDITEQTTAVINGIVAGDNVTVQMINGAFEQPDATHDSEGNRLENGLSPNVKIAVNQITLKNIVYNTLAAQGLLANYCMAGEVATDAQLGNVVITDTGMILRKIIDASTVTLESDTFESVYGEGSYVLPQIYANIDGRQEAVNPQSVMFRQGGAEVANPVNVGGYELYAYGIAFDNYETGELGGLLVNSARAATDPDEGGESGGEEGGEPVEPEIKEVYTYYIVPKEIVITGVSKFYDASAELTYPAEGEEGLFAKVSVTDKEGNPVNDGEGELVLRLQGRMSDALAGKAKDVLADFVLFGYYENFTDVAKQYYRLVVLAEDGTAVAGNYCIAAAEGEVELPVQFDPDYVPEDPQNDDTPVLNNGIVYNMTLLGKGTVIPRPLTAEGVVKTYDGNADITTGTLTGWLEQDAASLADWRYDSKDAGVRDIWVNTDGDAYVYDDGEMQTTYYAIYVKGEDGSLILSNYSVEAAGLQTVEIPPIEEGGEPTEVTYAVISGAGKINKYALGTQNVDGVRVGNTVLPSSVEYNGNYYDNDSVWAKISVLGMTAAYTKASGGTITFVLANGDEIVLRVSLNGGTRFKDAGQYPLTLTLEENTNYTMSAYSATFTISRQELTSVYVITGGHISKDYDALPDMPEYAKDGWVIAARDKQGNYIDGATLGEIDLAGANIVFTRFNEEEQKYEQYIPVNAGTYPVEVKGFEINATNYVFTQDMTAFGYVSYNVEESTGERANYIINPYKLDISSALAQSEKKFDGSYSLRMSGAAGETVVIRDAAGNNYSLAGSYTDIPFVPEVANVLIGKDALNEQSVVTNYAVYNGSEQVTGQVTIAQLTVTPSDVLVAERDGNSYGVGISGLQGLDFVFANSSLDVEAKKLILNKAESGQQLSDGEKAAFAEALASVLTVYLNNGTEAVTVNGIKGFTYTQQQNSYVFAFTFSGADNHDLLTATDRYTLAVKGSGSGQDGQNYALSTNAMATSSHLASGQVYSQTSGSVTTAEELKEKIKNNQDISLANSIYGVDLSDVSATAYSATFEGNGHTLGITGSLSDKETESSKGWLFAVNNGTIRNLSVVIMPDGASAGATNTGFVGKNNGTVQNVSVRLMTDMTVSGAAYVGGIAGENGAGATIEQSDFVIGADIDVQGAVFGAVSANSQGTLSGVAVRTDDATYGGEDYRTFTVNAASATVTGQGSPAVNGVIIAVEAGRVNGFTVSVIDGATNVYSYQDYQGANGGQLSLLTPYTTGYIGYYFVGQQEYAGAFDDNMLNAKGEVNKSAYRDYTAQSGYVAVEAIASYGRFVWDGYGINYKTPLGESVVGSALNRVVAIFAEGDISSQFEGTATVTNGVDAFTVALGIRGGNVEIEGGASVSTKEVIYNGNTQEYKVTVTVNGVQKEIMVAGKDAGYYTKAILEGLLPGDGETIGDVTYDSGSRTEYVFTGGATATNGIALIIYPKQTSADDVTAQKYYDSASDATVTLTDGQKDVASVNGIYYDDSANVTADVLKARKAGVINFANVTRSVLVKDGIFYAVVQNVEMTETGAVTTYTTQQITYTATVDGKLTQVPFTTQTTIDETGISEFMRAYARLTDRAYAEQYLDESTLQEYEFVTVYNVTAFVTVTQGENGKSTASFSQPVYAPVLSGINGENASNYALYGSDWTFDRNTILASAQDEQQINALQPDYTVNGVILPVDLGLQAQYTRGRDQSYNDAMILPEASLKDGAVGSMITAEQAQQKYGITAEQYAVIVNALTEKGITLSGSTDEIFSELVQSGVLKSENGNYYTVNKQYATDSELPAKLNAGNFIVSFADGERNVAFRYFGVTVHSDGNVYYEFTSESDYAMWADNEGGIADYYAIDMLLTNDIDFGGKECAMLAWRDGEGNVVGYQGTFDGDGYAMRGMLIARQSSAALFERIDETGVVRNLTVADSIVIATGDNASASGIAVDNYGSIQNCAYEGIVSAGGESSKTVNAGGIAAANYGSVTDAVSVNRTYVSAADGAAVTIEGIAADKQGGSTEGSISLQENDNLVAGAREQSTVIESNGEASDYAQIKDDETVTAVISAYVFDERYIKVDTDGKFVTDNFFKLNAVDILFGWIGAEAVTHSVQNGFYGQITLE